MLATFSFPVMEDDQPDVTIEADWFQLTYQELRVSPEGDFVARFNVKDDVWEFNGKTYTDIVISNEC